MEKKKKEEEEKTTRKKKSRMNLEFVPFIKRYPGFEFRKQDQVHLLYKNSDGRVAYVGPTHFAPGIWLGVELTMQVGKNDGSVGDKRYFKCRQEYGVFVRPESVVRCWRPTYDPQTGEPISPRTLPEPVSQFARSPSPEKAKSIVQNAKQRHAAVARSSARRRPGFL